jgi:hypothetical protein
LIASLVTRSFTVRVVGCMLTISGYSRRAASERHDVPLYLGSSQTRTG